MNIHTPNDCRDRDVSAILTDDVRISIGESGLLFLLEKLATLLGDGGTCNDSGDSEDAVEDVNDLSVL